MLLKEKHTKTEKPISMQRREFINQLNELLNSGLDTYLIEPILKDALAVVQQSLLLREQHEVQEYKDSLKKVKEGKDG